MQPNGCNHSDEQTAPVSPIHSFTVEKSIPQGECGFLAAPANRQRWLTEVFRSPPRRNVRGRSRPTQRFIFEDANGGDLIVAEGGNEMTAAILLRYLKNIGIVKRYKLQPFNLNEICPGLDATPDFLVELRDGRIYILEIKARRFINADVLNKIETVRAALLEHKLQYLLWTDRDPYGITNKIHRSIWNNTREIFRGWAIPMDQETEEKIREKVIDPNCSIGDIDKLVGWDMTIAALARGLFFINLEETINEKSTVQATFPAEVGEHFFATRSNSKTWWDSLPDF